MKILHYCSGIVDNYRPQRSCGKVMFLDLTVILSTGGCVSHCMLGYTPTLGREADHLDRLPLGRHPNPRQTPPADGYCSGRYYWNAFLFGLYFILDLSYISDEVIEEQVLVPVVKSDPSKANPRIGVGIVSFSPDSRYFFTRNGT